MNINLGNPFTCFGADIPEPGFTTLPADSTSVYIPPVAPSGNVISNGNEPLNNNVIQTVFGTVEKSEEKRHILKPILAIGAAFALYSILT